MPELPEVETIRRDLDSVLVGQKILGLSVGKPKLVRNNLVNFEQQVVGQEIKGVKRRGKLLIVVLGNDSYILVHLKMTGQLIYRSQEQLVAGGHSLSRAEDNFNLPNKYTHLQLHLDGATLFFNDLRQFGYWQLVDAQGREQAESKYGLEPLSKEFNFNKWLALTRRFGRSTVKSLLLNQSVVAGIGNIYADEIAFSAGVLPSRRVESLNKEELKAVFLAIKPILKDSIKHRGTTFNDYRDASGKKGNYVSKLKVYGRKGESCRRCKKGVIEKTKQNGRGTHYCLSCQK